MPTNDPFWTDADIEADRLGPVFMAEYEGFCSAGCGPIEPGDDIRADGQGGYVHAECAE